MDNEVNGGRRRRMHSPTFKAQVLQACSQPGVSIAAVALSNGLNANLVRRWLNERDVSGAAGDSTAYFSIAHRRGQICGGATRGSPRRGGRYPTGTAPGLRCHERDLAAAGGCRLRHLAAGVVAMIRIDALWLAVEPVDMRAGADRLLARVVQVFGASRAHHAYVFSNARATRVKLVVHDGFGVWCAVRRLNIGGFVWPRDINSSSPSSSLPSSPPSSPTLTLTKEQFDALALGLPWQRLEEYKLITRM